MPVPHGYVWYVGHNSEDTIATNSSDKTGVKPQNIPTICAGNRLVEGRRKAIALSLQGIETAMGALSGVANDQRDDAKQESSARMG